MFEKLRSKKDARLYFKYKDLEIPLGKLKTILIRLEFLEHVEGDRYIELKRLPTVNKLKEILLGTKHA